LERNATLSRYGRFWLPVLVAVALVLASCGAGGAGSRSGGDMQGMDHGSMGSGGMARQMVMEDGRYSDRAFIDAMVPHHRGAIDMAEVALGNAEHREVKELAEDIVSAQEAEIERLKAI
jgi:uncharacterized protein (DUF305 family)